jgi:hypothetical protein
VQYVVILTVTQIVLDCNICIHGLIENDVVIGDCVTFKGGVPFGDDLRLASDAFIRRLPTIGFPAAGVCLTRLPVGCSSQFKAIANEVLRMPEVSSLNKYKFSVVSTSVQKVAGFV